MIHKRKKRKKVKVASSSMPIAYLQKKNTVSNNSFSEKQKGGVNFKATCNLSTPFSGTFITRRHKKNLRAFRLENFCCQNSATNFGNGMFSFPSRSLIWHFLVGNLKRNGGLIPV